MEECFIGEEVEPWSRFKPRVLDPFGEWESSPDGKFFLIEKRPSMETWKSRWARRLTFKLNLKRDRQAFKLAYSFSDMVGRVLKSTPTKEIKETTEGEILRTCPVCGQESLIPPKLFGGKDYCASCGYIPRGKNTGEHKLTLAYHKYFQLFLELEKLEPSAQESEELHDWEDVSPWVPLPLVPEDEGHYASSSKEKRGPGDWAVEKIKGAKSVKDIAPLGKTLYKYSSSWSFETRAKMWAVYKARKQKLALYKKLASNRLLKPVLDARDKIILATDEKTVARINEWVGKLPRLTYEEKEEVKNFLNSFLPKELRGE